MCDVAEEKILVVRDSEGKKCEKLVCLVIDCSRANGRLLLEEVSGGRVKGQRVGSRVSI